MFVILLTNRVHAATARRPAKVISDVRADLADAAELAVTDLEGGMLDMPKSFRADRAVGWNKPETKVSRSRASRARAAARARAKARAKTASHRSRSSRSSHASASKAKSSKSPPKKSSARKSASSHSKKAHAG